MAAGEAIFNRDSSKDILGTITCTRDSTKDVIGHASQIDNNTLYNIENNGLCQGDKIIADDANINALRTNCITEIPQDIKLELNNGTLTLKAGSKLYKGNSTFIVTEEDKSITGTNASAISFYDVENNSLEWRLLSECYSQATAPTNTQYMLWLDTANETVKATTDTGATWHECSLPVCIFTAGSTQITSIDQVFNGFGYIGSTVFALPGVKGLIPNGRNADGSLKNIEFVNDRVKTFTLSISETSILNLYDGTIGIDIATYTLSKFFIQNNAPTNYQYMLWLDTLNNEFKYTENTGNSWVKVNLFNVATLITADAGITSFTPKTVFHAVDRNDSSWLSGLGMPSSRYINLTLGASGATYTAPANGWIEFVKQSTGAQYFQFANDTSGWFNNISTPSSGQYLSIFAPVHIGDSFRIEYNLGGVTAKFRFYYAEGEAN